MSYLKETGQLTPEKSMEIEHKVNLGYQRMLSFEIKDTGGFDWYGQSPAKIILSAYGLLILSDMKKIYSSVDENVIERAYKFLRSKQNHDGSWSLDKSMYTWHQLSNANLPLTAYVTWALVEAGYKDAVVTSAIRYIKNNLSKAEDVYVQALCTNALVGYDKNDVSGRKILEALQSAVKDDGKKAYWETSIQGISYSRGNSANIEATALAVYAFLKASISPNLVSKALTFIATSKDSDGSWGSTQATVLCLKALIEASKSFKNIQKGRVALHINGQKIEKAFESIDDKNHDVMQQVNITQFLKSGENELKLETADDLTVSYQFAGRYFMPWSQVEVKELKPPLTINVEYDKTTLKSDETVKATVLIKYFENTPTFMVIADLGIPPGFSVETSDLDELVSKRVIDKYSLTGRQITIYLGKVTKNTDYTFSYRLKAKYPIRAKASSSMVYEYYSPDKKGSSKPIEFYVQ